MTDFFEDERTDSPLLLSRRSLIVGSGGLALVGAATLLTASPAFAASASDGKLTDVIAAAKSYVGKDLAQMNKIWSSSYKTEGDWCAIFASWLTRGTNVKKNASSKGLYGELPHHSTPKAGDIIYYRGAETTGHVGLVIKVTKGVAETIEGNAGTGTAKTNHVKHYLKPWAPSEVVGYARPTYK
jgi:hypothetical protein